MIQLSTIGKLGIYFALVVGSFYPILRKEINAKQTKTVSIPTHSTKHQIFDDKLQNGLIYRIIASNFSKKGTWIKVSFESLGQPCEQALLTLTQYTLFCRSQNLQNTNFNVFSLDIKSLKNCWQSNEENEESLEFYFFDCDLPQIKNFFKWLSQFLFFNTINDEEIEAARQYILKNNITSSKESDLIHSITPNMVKQFYAEHMQPDKVQLTIVSEFDLSEIKNALQFLNQEN